MQVPIEIIVALFTLTLTGVAVLLWWLIRQVAELRTSVEVISGMLVAHEKSNIASFQHLENLMHSQHEDR